MHAFKKQTRTHVLLSRSESIFPFLWLKLYLEQNVYNMICRTHTHFYYLVKDKIMLGNYNMFMKHSQHLVQTFSSFANKTEALGIFKVKFCIIRPHSWPDSILCSNSNCLRAGLVSSHCWRALKVYSFAWVKLSNSLFSEATCMYFKPWMPLYIVFKITWSQSTGNAPS